MDVTRQEGAATDGQRLLPRRRPATPIGTENVAASDVCASGAAFNWVGLAVTVAAFAGARFAGWRATAKADPVGTDTS